VGRYITVKRISRQGEVLEVAQSLTATEIESGLPPPGYGASANLADLLEGEALHCLNDSMDCVKPEKDLPASFKIPKAHAEPKDWCGIRRVFYFKEGSSGR
jgi:hypothetical protein